MTTSVHETALVHARAVLGSDVMVGPYAVIEEGARIGDGSKIAAHVVIRRSVVLGERVTIDSFATIGGDAQMLAPSGDPSGTGTVVIGDGVTIREGCTIHRPATPGGCTCIGRNVFLMANAHVAHDCRVDDDVVLGNNVLLGGHVHVGCFTFMGGGSGVHQFTRIGESAMIAGNATMTQDVPPFTMAAERNAAYGLNVVGLKRRGFSQQVIAALRRCFKVLCASAGDPRRKAKRILAMARGPLGAEARRFLEFFLETKRGFIRFRRKSGQPGTDPATDEESMRMLLLELQREPRAEPVTRQGDNGTAAQQARQAD